MDVVVVDLETTGLDVELARIHCVVAQIPGDAPLSWGPGQIPDAIKWINNAIDAGITLAGHNIIEYDIPILRRYGVKDPGPSYDTLVISRAAYPGNTLGLRDQEFIKKNPALKDKLHPGLHSLESWGYRLRNNKAEYTGGWEEFSQEMLDYCIQDVALNVDLLAKLRSIIPDSAALLECQVASICRDMRLHGVGFDVSGAQALTLELVARRDELTKTLRETFKPWYVAGKVKTPKRSMKSRAVQPGDEGFRDVAAGCPYQEIILTEFNPASGDHIADRLIKLRKWKPTHYTENSRPQVTSEILRDLSFPEAPLLAEYLELQKIIGYIAEGKNAWLKLEKNGRLHGKVVPTGTVTSRAAHSSPNLGNVPSRTELGHRCRSLFVAPSDRVLVGADASGLQLRGLAHYLARWDEGAFARQCETGDIHEYMRKGTQLLTRDRQKTWTYAKLFGAGKAKLGQIAIQDRILARERGIECEIPSQRKAAALGQQTIDNLGDAIPAFAELEKALSRAAKKGSMTTLDGRTLPIGSEHLAISVLLQGFEACVMKQAMVFAKDSLRSLFAKQVLWVHDEFQVECKAESADNVGRILVSAMNRAGEHFGLRVRIDGEYKIGKNWGETH